MIIFATRLLSHRCIAQRLTLDTHSGHERSSRCGSEAIPRLDKVGVESERDRTIVPVSTCHGGTRSVRVTAEIFERENPDSPLGKDGIEQDPNTFILADPLGSILVWPRELHERSSMSQPTDFGLALVQFFTIRWSRLPFRM
jgi:hypothetical protein